MNEERLKDLRSQLAYVEDFCKRTQDLLNAMTEKKAQLEKEISDIIVDGRKAHFEDLKSKHPDALLLFRHGDFYEAFEDDAVVVCNVLDLTISHNNVWHNYTGFPHYALDAYLPKLIRAGHRVAICDEYQPPRNLVKRGK